MSRYNALCASLAVVIASLVWAPDMLPAAAVVAALAAFAAMGLPAACREAPAPVVRRLPTAGRSRWMPGFGVGFGPLFVGLFRWRR